MSDMKLKEQQEPWQWEEETWRKLVEKTRAGRTFRPKKWPGDACCAVAISFDSDHETNELRDGGRSISRLSWGQYGNRVGIPRIEAILQKWDAKATFFVPAVAALLHPEEQCRLVAQGHEIGIHGWIHELNSALPYEDERTLMLRASDALESITGVRPVGLRTPSWDFSQGTLAIAVEMGLHYDSSLMADEDCYELLLDGKPTEVMELPVEWIRDDAAYFAMSRFSSLRPYISPEDVFDIFRRELQYEIEHGGLFQLTLHPHVISARSRIWILDELLKIARHHGAWIATHADVISHVKTHASA